jgi:hypothetical protein
MSSTEFTKNPCSIESNLQVIAVKEKGLLKTVQDYALKNEIFVSNLGFRARNT